MGYGFRKIYADLVTDDGTVCVAYLTWVRLFRKWTGMGGVELYWPDGRREILRSTVEPPLLEAGTPGASGPFRLVLGELTFELEYATDHGAWQPSTPSPATALHWHVQQVRGCARVRWSDPERASLEGRGYVDFVQIDRPTRLLGFRSLRWGRVHLPDRTLILEELRCKAGDWRPGLDWSREAGAVSGEAVFHPDGGSGEVRVLGGGPPVTLEAVRVLHDGSAFDADRVPSAVERALCLAVGGPTYETRWLARARCGEAAGWALHEAVTFGRR